MLSEPPAHPKLLIYSSLHFIWVISDLNPLFQIFAKLCGFEDLNVKKTLKISSSGIIYWTNFG